MKKVCLFLLLLVSHVVNASECDATTTPRDLELGGESPSYTVLDKVGGNYVALFDTGDMLLAAFSQCGLGMHAHYYSLKVLSDSERAARLTWMLAAVLPSADRYEHLKSQLPSESRLADGMAVSVRDGPSQSHEFIFRPSESPLFGTVLHYTWNAPEY